LLFLKLFMMVNQVSMVYKDRGENKVPKENKDQQDHQERLDLKDQSDRKALPGKLVPRETQVITERPELSDHQENEEHRERTERMEYRASKASKDHPVQLVLPGLSLHPSMSIEELPTQR
jgi:flagellar biosynthesis/type III secretory pathway M-ring protein FliF/YscJ